MTSKPCSSLLAHHFTLLNPSQKKAVETVHGRLLILAGAGSGKTKVLTLRMAHLLQNCGVSPKSILGLTFTNKAAEEMRHRLGQLVDLNIAKQVTLSTFHSFCMQVLRNDIDKLGFTSQFTLYDEKDIQRLIALIARDELEHESETLPSLGSTVQAISWAKNRGLKEEEISDPSSPWHEQFTRTVYKRLQDSLRAYNAVDFDNLLTLTLELFENHPAVLEKYQERFQYIMIDEYQDTNPVQYRLASLLASKYHNLCVVGDDDQSIYGWRGAEVRNILDFNDAVTIKLEQNYRSTNLILKAANGVIEKNSERHPRFCGVKMVKVSLLSFFTLQVKRGSASRCLPHRTNKAVYGPHVERYCNTLSLKCLKPPFEFALLRQPWKSKDSWVTGIPYQVFGGQEFYERKEVKDLFCYLRVICNPFDQEALLRIINQPRRGIGESTLDRLTACNRKEGVPLWTVLNEVLLEESPLRQDIPAKSLKGIETFVNVVEKSRAAFEQKPLDQALKWLVDEIDYKKAIHEEVKSAQMRMFKWSNVQEFIDSLSGQKSLQDYVQNTPLEANWNKKQQGIDEDKVTLMTFHSAKGLEFEVVFLVCMEDHIIPHEKSMKQTGLEEERRLMYVATTRAKKFLTISMSRQRSGWGRPHRVNPPDFYLTSQKSA